MSSCRIVNIFGNIFLFYRTLLEYLKKKKNSFGTTFIVIAEEGDWLKVKWFGLEQGGDHKRTLVSMHGEPRI